MDLFGFDCASLRKKNNLSKILLRLTTQKLKWEKMLQCIKQKKLYRIYVTLEKKDRLVL